MNIEWLLKKPSKVEHVELLSADARLETLPSRDGVSLYVVKGGAGYFVKGGLLGISWGQSVIGAIPLYHLETKDGVYISDNLKSLYIQCKMRRLPKSGVVLCQTGETYYYCVKTKKVKTVKADVLRYTGTLDIDLPEAAKKTLEVLVKSAEYYKGKKVVTTISAGTDGLLTALALKLAGVEQYCVCVGVDETYFDPSHARGYAEEIGLNYTFLSVPTDQEELQRLLTTCISSIEMHEYTNTLMGICNTMVAEYAKSIGADIVFCADIADMILGNDLQSAGRFKKQYTEEQRTSENWANFRIKNHIKVMPNNLQVYKAYNQQGIPCTQLWYNQPVLDYILQLPLECTPISRKKVLYYSILEKYVSNPSWGANGKKIGYYTGAGIGKLREKNATLSDENMRNTYKTVFKDIL